MTPEASEKKAGNKRARWEGASGGEGIIQEPVQSTRMKAEMRTGFRVQTAKSVLKKVQRVEERARYGRVREILSARSGGKKFDAQNH